jgi:M6 family metalloprotease-like protein
MHVTRRLFVVLALCAAASGISAQDVEMLGRRYGTVPPAAYFQQRARDPNAYNFTRGRAAPGRMLERQRALAAGGVPGAASLNGPARLSPINDPVEGTFLIPVLLGQFSDSPATPPFSRATIQQEYFDAPTTSITAYYDEVSRGSVVLTGDTRNWVGWGNSMTQAAVTQNQSSLLCCGIGNWIKLLIDLQGGVNWGLYDNDGADGLPNSGDDDGYVDALAVIHPTMGAECGGTGSSGRIWSHKWALSFASNSGPKVTNSPSNAPGVPFIRIDDYFVQGAVQCGGSGLNEIGVFTHEAGHAFGLPDLYDTRSSGAHNGAGNWDLMASGAYGCTGQTPSRPCHMGAFTKAMLGWVDVTALPGDSDLGTLTLPPVESTGSVYLVYAGDGSGEYFLLENRQRMGFDQELFAEGLLVWQIDANALETRWFNNEVNASNHMAVWLRQADGCDDLGRTSSAAPPGCDAPGRRGDEGDPFPGASGNTAFHAGSNPGSISFPGTGTGLTVLDIAGVGNDVSFRALTRFTDLTLTVTGTSSATGIFTVDGDAVPAPPGNVVTSAPFEVRTVEAAGGEVLQEGVRSAFVEWTDAPNEPRVRLLQTPMNDTEYVAAYGGTQYELRVDLAGGVNGVAPGTIQTTPASPDLWFAPSTVVQLSAVPQTGFAFLAWTGALVGQSNPGSVVMNGPVLGGANFQLVYNVADVELSITATEAQDVQLVAESGTAPIHWTITAGSLPGGLTLSTAGRLTGAALDAGSFPVTVQALDGLGLAASATLTLDVEEPVLTVEALASHFLLSGPQLSGLQEVFLDRFGNGLDGFDLGDFRAWLLAHPALPLSAALTAPTSNPTPVRIPMRLHFKAEEP